MRTSEATIAKLFDNLTGLGNVRAQKMFGEYALYCDEKVVALVCRNELVVKNTEPGRALAPDLELLPAYPGAKPGLHVPQNRWSEPDFLRKLLRSTADSLPSKIKK